MAYNFKYTKEQILKSRVEAFVQRIEKEFIGSEYLPSKYEYRTEVRFEIIKDVEKIFSQEDSPYTIRYLRARPKSDWVDVGIALKD